MTLWRRAPREVYRVYDEEDFFSHDMAEPLGATAAEPGDIVARPHRLPAMPRAVAPAVLVLALGGLGGLATLADLPLLSGARRGGRLALSVTAPALNRSQRPPRRWGRVHRHVQRLYARGAARHGRRSPRRSKPGPPRLMRAVASHPRTATVMQISQQPVAAVSTKTRTPGVSEFGFER